MGTSLFKSQCLNVIVWASSADLGPNQRKGRLIFTKKKEGFFGHEGVLLGCSLAGFVACGSASVAWLGILPKVACHGDDGR